MKTESVETQTEDTQILGKTMPSQIVWVTEGDIRRKFYDADGDLIRYDNAGSDYISEYLCDEQGKKIYGEKWEEGIGISTTVYGRNEMPHGTNISEYSGALVSKETHVKDADYAYEYRYDEKNRLAGWRFSQWEGEASYEYSDLGNGVTLVTWSDTTTSDERGELEFDADGNVIRTDLAYFSSFDGSFERETETNILYDGDGRVKMIKVVGTYKNPAYDYTRNSSYSYDADGNLISKKYEGTMMEHNKDTGEYEECQFAEYTEFDGYDENGNYSVKKKYQNDELQAAFFYEYDAHGNIMKETYAAGLDEKTLYFQYDEKERLTGISADDVLLYQFHFDENGLLESTEWVNRYVTEEFELNYQMNDKPAGFDFNSPLLAELCTEIGSTIKKYTGIEIADGWGYCEMAKAEYIDFTY